MAKKFEEYKAMTICKKEEKVKKAIDNSNKKVEEISDKAKDLKNKVKEISDKAKDQKKEDIIETMTKLEKLIADLGEGENDF